MDMENFIARQIKSISPKTQHSSIQQPDSEAKALVLPALRNASRHENASEACLHSFECNSISRKSRFSCIRAKASILLCLLGMTLNCAAANPTAEPDPAEISLEQLVNANVDGASRKPQQLQNVAAAAFVITREDIERSGATSIPELLRMAPGIQAARIASNRWAVSARGINSRFSNQLLVLLDGRTIYTPLFSGVIWEMQDTLLEDIERIEVIRGPGAAIWGANAVNGVINIITRRPRDTQGNLAVVGAGTEERGFAAFRHGGQAGDGHYRVWGKASAGDESAGTNGQAANDAWHKRQAGFRADWQLAGGNQMLVTGGAFKGSDGDLWNLTNPVMNTVIPVKVGQTGESAHLLARHKWRHLDGSESALQAYVEHSDFSSDSFLSEHRTTTDLDFQNLFRIGNAHEIVWGLGYRRSHDHLAYQGFISVSPARRTNHLASAFIQDDVTLLPDRLRLSLGARLEHDSYNGFYPQPSMRVIWTPTSQQSVWGAVSRARRLPSRVEQGARISLMGPLFPSPRTFQLDIETEKLTAYELGYRHQFHSRLSLDVAAFHHRYHDMTSVGLSVLQPGAPLPDFSDLPETNNSMRAHSNGIEVALDWHPAFWWRIQPSYTFLRVKTATSSDNIVDQINASRKQDSAPRNQLSLRSMMSLPGGRQLDVWLRHSDAIGDETLMTRVASYTTVDARYAWRVSPGLELSIVGQNLLGPRHTEFVADYLPSQVVKIERSVYLKARMHF